MTTASQRTTHPAHTGGPAFFIIASLLYASFIGLFLWQTAQFVTWLFPDDQLIWRFITVCIFDVMAIIWALIETFYRFATKGLHDLVKWAWGISFVASLIASVFYMILQAMTRLDFLPPAEWSNIGYSIVIVVTVLQILFLTFWIRGEWMVRHPKLNDYEYSPAPVQTTIQEELPPVSNPPQLAAPAPAGKKVGMSATPLSSGPVKNSGPYVVNRQMAAIPIND